MKSNRVSRRYFLMGTGATLAGAFAMPSWAKRVRSNNKINIAHVGAGGRGGSHVSYFGEHENLVGVCDADDSRAASIYAKFPNVHTFRDWREMFDKQKNIEAVVIATPDHVHAPVAMAAMQMGKHVYCEKPLTHSIYEARVLTKAAKKYGVMTQMGNQGHSGHGVRELCEMIWSGAIGDVKEVHCWTDRPLWPQGIPDPLPEEPLPNTLDWDVWIGPAPMRPYNHEYLPFNWRGWWDFGCGALGDMGCHIMDASFWALHLGAPTAVEVVEVEGLNSQTAPKKSHLKLEFPERTHEGKKFAAVTMHWYDGGYMPPRPEGVPEDEKLGDTIFIGEKGALTCQTYGENPRLLPASKMADYKKPDPYLPRIEGEDHRADWTRAIRDGKPSASDFSYAGPLTETVSIGNLALRAGGRIEWDSKNMKVTNLPEANQFVRRQYRKGWTL